MDKFVRNIIGSPVGTMSRVSLDIKLFMDIARSKPSLAYRDVRDGQTRMREFVVDGAKVYSHFNKETNKTIFLMDTVEANNRLETMAQKNAEEAVSLGIANFLSAPEYTAPAVA